METKQKTPHKAILLKVTPEWLDRLDRAVSRSNLRGKLKNRKELIVRELDKYAKSRGIE